MTEPIDLKFVAGQAVQAAGEAVQKTDEGTFLVTNDNIIPHRPDDRINTPVAITTLDGIKRAIEKETLGRDVVSVNVLSPRSIKVLGKVDTFGRRDVLATTDLDFDDFSFGQRYSREEMIVALQSKFDKNEDRDTLLRFISNVKASNEQNFIDDGVTQTAKAATGVASLNNVVVPNPVSLRPFRTFTEVEQPESKFVFRMNNEDSFTLFEADGGIWKRRAITNIGEYLEVDLALAVPVIY